MQTKHAVSLIMAFLLVLLLLAPSSYADFVPVDSVGFCELKALDSTHSEIVRCAGYRIHACDTARYLDDLFPPGQTQEVRMADSGQGLVKISFYSKNNWYFLPHGKISDDRPLLDVAKSYCQQELKESRRELAASVLHLLKPFFGAALFLIFSVAIAIAAKRGYLKFLVRNINLKASILTSLAALLLYAILFAAVSLLYLQFRHRLPALSNALQFFMMLQTLSHLVIVVIGVRVLWWVFFLLLFLVFLAGIAVDKITKPMPKWKTILIKFIIFLFIIPILTQMLWVLSGSPGFS